MKKNKNKRKIQIPAA
jgi:hypothetical protein